MGEYQVESSLLHMAVRHNRRHELVGALVRECPCADTLPLTAASHLRPLARNR
jgi:hypothetical protein